MPKYKETKISILIPDVANKSVHEMIEQIKTSNPSNNIFISNLVKANEEDKFNITIITDRELSDEDIMEYYMQVMVYHQAIGENLSEKEMDIRDKEVNDKWLNGNFNYWILDEEAV